MGSAFSSQAGSLLPLQKRISLHSQTVSARLCNIAIACTPQQVYVREGDILAQDQPQCGEWRLHNT